jgi:DNA-directed RNA polymerase
MDGSCNGLQHYAAIGRDKHGAEQVNLRDSFKPGDLYTHVANMVENKINEDCKDETGPNFEIASKLQGKIKRKIVK